MTVVMAVKKKSMTCNGCIWPVTCVSTKLVYKINKAGKGDSQGAEESFKPQAADVS